jgi:hypothetical protein
MGCGDPDANLLRYWLMSGTRRCLTCQRELGDATTGETLCFGTPTYGHFVDVVLPDEGTVLPMLLVLQVQVAGQSLAIAISKAGCGVHQ